MTNKYLSVAAVTLASLAWCGGAAAATCVADYAPTDPDASVTHASACGPGTDGNDEASDIDLLGQGTGWVLIDRDNMPDAGSAPNPGDGENNIDGGFWLDGTDGASNPTVGNWYLNRAVANYANFILVIKDGNTGGNTDWFWFRLSLTPATAGTCATTAPGSTAGSFTECGTWTMYGIDDKLKGLSHMTLYGRGGGGGGFPMPEPGTLALLGLGLMGLGFARRKV